MKRWWVVVIALAVLGGSYAYGDGDDGIMGDYSGKVGELPGRAQIVALGDDRFKGRLFNWTFSELQIENWLEIEGGREGGVIKFTGGRQSYRPTSLVLQDGRMTGTTVVDGRELAVDMGRVFNEPPALGAQPREGARVLFDGTNLDQWDRWPLKWHVADGAMEVVGSNLVTKESFGDCFIHLEFRTPFMPKARGQARGNSGVYVMGRYEIQVLDSYGEEPAWDYCGGIYKQAVPRENASLPPLQWQTYEIDFTAPRFDESGKKTEHARITVHHNGKLIHKDVTLYSATPGGVSGQEAPTGPILLQDHRDQVRFRNIWIVEK